MRGETPLEYLDAEQAKTVLDYMIKIYNKRAKIYDMPTYKCIKHSSKPRR